MCGFQSPSLGFFFFLDNSSEKQSKERSSSLVVTVIEGASLFREIEHEFNLVFGDGWRCTARPIGQNQFIMRFPNPREVERVVYYGSSMKLKTVDATVRLSTWTASIGSIGSLQKAWVRISNIPLDKRTDANYFYAGSLVGISLDLDSATLHKPEFVRVLIGCRDVERIPHMAEGCLGNNFYDFCYEVDKIVVVGPPRVDDATRMGGASRSLLLREPRQTLLDPILRKLLKVLCKAVRLNLLGIWPIVKPFLRMNLLSKSPRRTAILEMNF
jgi:hypothetical protein